MEEKDNSINNDSPDYSIKPVDNLSENEKPEIIKAKKITPKKQQTRREFIKNVGGVIGVAGLAGVLANCDLSTIRISTDAYGNCTCHVVCSCDTEGGDQSTESGYTYDSVWDGGTCTCDTVCTCNTVCTCDTVGSTSCSSCSSCGYWYPN